MFASKLLLRSLNLRSKSFSDHEHLFQHRSISELLRANLLLRISANAFFARNAQGIFQGLHRTLGDKAFSALFKPMVYNLFIAGEKDDEILKSMNNLVKLGLTPLLSPMLEEDPETSLEDDSRVVVRAHNYATIMRCMELVRQCEQLETKTLAIKLTAFIPMKCLENISQSLVENPDCLPSVKDGNQEESDLGNGIAHLLRICHRASDLGVHLLIDAEHSHLQPAVRALALSLMRRFNSGQTVVCNTYQTYLRGSAEHVSEDLAVAKREGFHFGAKVVRGAYLELERERAQTMRCESPVWDSYERTNDNYNRVVENLLVRKRSSDLVIIATHNQSSVFGASDLLGGHENNVHFAQLSGLADQLSLGLASSGLSCLKLVPCGSVSEVLPWLARRVQENHASRERSRWDAEIMGKELRRRILGK